jgi:hypothetical protein
MAVLLNGELQAQVGVPNMAASPLDPIAITSQSPCKQAAIGALIGLWELIIRAYRSHKLNVQLLLQRILAVSELLMEML